MEDMKRANFPRPKFTAAYHEGRTERACLCGYQTLQINLWTLRFGLHKDCMPFLKKIIMLLRNIGQFDTCVLFILADNKHKIKTFFFFWYGTSKSFDKKNKLKQE